MINTTNWKEFRVGDLFTPYLGGNPSNSKISDFGKYAIITASSDNNGILGYTDYYQEGLVFSNIITLGNRGSYNAFYHPYDVYLGNNVLALEEKVEMTKNQKLFITTLINKFHYDGYTNYPTKTNIVEEILLLPTKNDQPDFDYMESYIEEIKLKYINTLEKDNNEHIDKALKITGLSYQDLNKDLTVKPADRYEEFRVGNLFEIRPTKNHKLVNNDLYDINGINPVIANSGLNNGITGYTNLSCTERGNIITFSDTTDHNSIFYQPYDFVGYSHIQGLYPINHKDKWKSATLLYFMTVFKKMAASYSFSYGNKFTRYKAMNFKLLLPAIDENTPDFDYMEKAIYIYILQKRLNLKNYLTKKK